MLIARSIPRARTLIEQAGYRVGSEVELDDRVFVSSLEGDRACYGHPMMEVMVPLFEHAWEVTEPRA